MTFNKLANARLVLREMSLEKLATNTPVIGRRMAVPLIGGSLIGLGALATAQSAKSRSPVRKHHREGMNPAAAYANLYRDQQYPQEME